MHNYGYLAVHNIIMCAHVLSVSMRDCVYACVLAYVYVRCV